MDFTDLEYPTAAPAGLVGLAGPSGGGREKKPKGKKKKSGSKAKKTSGSKAKKTSGSKKKKKSGSKAKKTSGSKKKKKSGSKGKKTSGSKKKKSGSKGKKKKAKSGSKGKKKKSASKGKKRKKSALRAGECIAWGVNAAYAKRQVFEGHTYPTTGPRKRLWGKKAVQTRSGLRKKDLMENAQDQIVSIKKHRLGKKAFKANGLEPGF